jgi:hypothetical protein
LLGLIFAISFTARSDVKTAPATQKKLCYCGCDMEQGAPMCLQMCELPKYENRSWATSCRKVARHTNGPARTLPQTGAKKSNRAQSARL